MKFRSFAESLFITLTALAASLALFGLFMVSFRTFSGETLKGGGYGGSFLPTSITGCLRARSAASSPGKTR